MKCHHASLSFGRNGLIDLYVVQAAGTIDVFSGCAATETCLWISRFQGSLEEIFLDQKRTPVSWRKMELPSFCSSPRGDARHSVSALEALTYDVANAMNSVMKDPGFSRFVRKTIVGSWRTEDSLLHFSRDGAYRIDGSSGPIRYSPPSSGRWSVGGRMMHLMDESGQRGVRVAIVGVNDSQLIFHGGGGALFHVYERVKEFKAAQPGATDNPDNARRLREDH